MSEPRDRAEIARYCEELFGSDRRGQLIFDYLCQRFVRPAVLKGGIDAILQNAHNGGARAVIDEIAQLVDAGRRPDPPDPGEV